MWVRPATWLEGRTSKSGSSCRLLSSLGDCLLLVIWGVAPGIELHRFRHRSHQHVMLLVLCIQMIDNDCCLVGFGISLKSNEMRTWSIGVIFPLQEARSELCTLILLYGMPMLVDCPVIIYCLLLSARHGWKNKPYLKTRVFLLRPAVNHPMCLVWLPPGVRAPCICLMSMS